MNPGAVGNRERLGSGPNREETLGDLVNFGIISDPTAHSRIEVNSQNVSPRAKGQRITADPRTEIDDQRTRETRGFILGDELRRALLDPDRIDPHLLAALELRHGLATALEQSDRGGDSLGRSQFPKPGYVRGTDRSDLRNRRQKAKTRLGRQDPGFRIDRTSSARVDLGSSRRAIATRMEMRLHAEHADEETVLLAHFLDLERSVPAAPPIVREPLRLGQVPIPSRFFLAPLAGYTSLAFRLAVRQCGGLGLATTDLVNARSLVEKRRRALELAETCDQDRPLSIQIYGTGIPEMEQAARWVVEEQGASAVDINMGCPVRKVVRNGGGSALMCQTDQAVELVAAVVNSVQAPVTVKMRLGWDDESLTAPALARAFEQVGVAAVIVHGRTREQGFKGKVNRAGIKAVVEAVERIPIVANGDILTIADVAATFEETGCAAVSIGRGALANPFIFQQLDCWVRTGEPGPLPSFEERLELMSFHFHGLVARRGEHYGCLQFRKILKWYYQFTRMPKPFYRSLLNLSSAALFDETVAAVQAAGPESALPGHYEFHVPVPSGAIDKW
jgi:tRNA-dihydrouridine synthase B